MSHLRRQPRAPIAVLFVIALIEAAVLNVAWNGVWSMNPGATAFTVIPAGANSLAAARVSPARPALAAA